MRNHTHPCRKSWHIVASKDAESQRTHIFVVSCPEIMRRLHTDQHRSCAHHSNWTVPVSCVAQTPPSWVNRGRATSLASVDVRRTPPDPREQGPRCATCCHPHAKATTQTSDYLNRCLQVALLKAWALCGIALSIAPLVLSACFFCLTRYCTAFEWILERTTVSHKTKIL